MNCVTRLQVPFENLARQASNHFCFFATTISLESEVVKAVHTGPPSVWFTQFTPASLLLLTRSQAVSGAVPWCFTNHHTTVKADRLTPATQCTKIRGAI